MVHLLGHLHIQSGVCACQDDVLLGLLTLHLHELVLAVLLLPQLEQKEILPLIVCSIHAGCTGLFPLVQLAQSSILYRYAYVSAAC